MNTSGGFSTGPRLSDAPQGDVARQAVAALRGYAFQLYGSVLAWLELKEGEDLFLEVAEDRGCCTRRLKGGSGQGDPGFRGGYAQHSRRKGSH